MNSSNCLCNTVIVIVLIYILCFNYSYEGVLDFCEDMEAVPGDPLASLARWYRYVYGDAECFDPSYATAVARYSNPAWDQIGTDLGSECIYFCYCC